MKKKLATVFDIINVTNTVTGNRYLAHALGTEVAIIYNALLAKYAYYCKHDMIPDDWFYSTVDDLWRSTALSEKTQKRAIAVLTEAGLIECKRKGIPAKRSFFICPAYDKILALIEQARTMLGENEAAEEQEKTVTVADAEPVQPKRRNKNSQKVRTSSAETAEHYIDKTKEKNHKSVKHHPDTKSVDDVMYNARLKGTYYRGIYKSPDEVSSAIDSIDDEGKEYIADCCEKHRSKIRNLSAYISSLVFTLAESNRTKIKQPQKETNFYSSFDAEKIDRMILEQYTMGF